MNNNLDNRNSDYSQSEFDDLEYPVDAQQAEAAKSEQAETGFGSKFAIFISLLAIIFTAIGITVGYKHWLRIDDKAQQALKQLSALQEKVDKTAALSTVDALRTEFMTTSDNNRQHLDEVMGAITNISEETKYAASTVKQQIAELTRLQNSVASSVSKKPAEQILLADVRMMLEAAPRRLRLAYDKVGAMELLKTADQLLVKMGYPTLLEVRASLATDIAELEAFDVPDVDQIIAKISTLEDEIKPIMTLEHESGLAEEITLFESDADNNASISGKVKQFINASVSIKKQKESPQAVLNTGDKQRIDQLVQLHLSSLRLIVLQHREDAFKDQIASLQALLSRYYLPSVAAPWLEMLDDLAKIKLKPQPPAIHSALQQLNHMAQKETLQ